MKTDGIFTTHTVEIKFDKYNSPIDLNVFGDIHWNSEQCDRNKFKEWCKEVKSRRRKQIYLGMGDYLDSISTSERHSLTCSSLHESTNQRIEKAIQKDLDEFIKQISFMKGSIIGVIGGNHFYNFSYGMSSDQLIAKGLGCKYLGVNSIIRILFLYNKGCGVHKFDICAHHGLGGGRTIGASMNKLQNMANSFDVDAILMGHDHNRAIDYINRIGLNDKCKLVNRRILIARTGTFLKCFEENKPSYAVDAAYPPSDLGALKITLTPCRKQEDRGTVDSRWIDIEATI